MSDTTPAPDTAIRADGKHNGMCVASGCRAPSLTAWHDGYSLLLLCEEHGDALAIGGFPLKQWAREVSA